MNLSLSDFTDLFDNISDDNKSSSPLSLSTIQEGISETCNSLEDISHAEKNRPAKYTAQCGELRSIQEIAPKYRHLFSYQHFNTIQSKIMDDALYTDKSLVVSAPTGSGKTVILEMTIVQLLMQLEDIKYTGDFKIIYIAPVKALCTERLTDWYSKFTQLGLLCIQVTGDTDVDFCDLKPYKIIITTPEKWDMLTRRWIANKDMVEVIKLFMIDEVHLLNDNVRGPVLEAVVSRMKIIEASVQMDRRNKVLKQDAGASLDVQPLPGGIRYVAISATVDNPGDVAQWLNNRHKPAVFYKLGDECRPVRLRKVVEGFPCTPGTSPFKFDMTLGYKLWPIIEKYHSGKPALIFCSTRKSVCMTADVLMREITFQFSADQRAKLINIASNIQDKKLQALVLVGVACHHAGYIYEDRHCIEQGFRSGDIPILVTTTTLAMGVNLPANLVIIKSTQQYINGGYQEYSLSTVLQMMGRAGRPQFDSEGTAVIMTTMQDKSRYTSMVSGAEPLESSLHRRMAEHLNSEIALGAVVDLAVAAEWARSTFLHVRATRQPRRYLGLPDDAPPQRVDKKIEDLCMVAINALSRHGMITFDEAVCLTSTDAGRLMSLYYLNLETMKLIIKINGKETLKEMIFLVCEGHEFGDSPLRVSEKTCLNTLNRPKSGENIRFQLKGKISTRQMKVNCILQSVFGCIPILDPSLNQESMKIIRIAERITNCIVSYLTRTCFVESHPAYLSAVLSAVTLAKCSAARLWEVSPNVTRQLRGIGPAYCAALSTAGKTTFQHIRDANPRDLERIMNKAPPAGNVLRQQVSLLPIYSIQLAQHAHSIKVTLQIDNCEQLQQHGGAEPLTAGLHHKIYLVAGDDHNNLLMFHCCRDKQLIQQFDGTISRTFETIIENEHTVVVHCISATFVGLDVKAEITVRAQTKTTQEVAQNITNFLPTQDSPHTNTIDLTNIDGSYYVTPKVSQSVKVGQTTKMTKKRSANKNVEDKPTPKKQKCATIERLDSFREQFSLHRATQQHLGATNNMMPPLSKQVHTTKPNYMSQSLTNTLPTPSCKRKTWGEIPENVNDDTAMSDDSDLTQNLKSPGSSWLNNLSDSYSERFKALTNTHIDTTFERVNKHFDSMIYDNDSRQPRHSNNDGSIDKSSNYVGSIDKSSYDVGSIDKIPNYVGSIDNNSNNVGSIDKRSDYVGSIDKSSYDVGSIDKIPNYVGSIDNNSNNVGSIDKRSDYVGSIDKSSYDVGSIDKIPNYVGSIDNNSNNVGSIDKRSDYVGSIDKSSDYVGCIDKIPNYVGSIDKIPNYVGSIDRNFKHINNHFDQNYKKGTNFDHFNNTQNFGKNLNNFEGNIRQSDTENMDVDFLLEAIEKEMKNNQIVEASYSHSQLKKKINEADIVDKERNDSKLFHTQNHDKSNMIYKNSADILRSWKTKYQRSIENSHLKGISKLGVEGERTNSTRTNEMQYVDRNFSANDEQNSSLAKNTESIQKDSPIRTIEIDHQNMNENDSNFTKKQPNENISDENEHNIIIASNEKQQNISEMCTQIITPSNGNIQELSSFEKPFSDIDEDMFLSPVEIITINDKNENFNEKNVNDNTCSYTEKSHSFSNVSKDKTSPDLRKLTLDLEPETENIDSIYTTNNTRFSNGIMRKPQDKTMEVPSELVFTTPNHEEITRSYPTELKSIYSEQSDPIRHFNSFSKLEQKIPDDTEPTASSLCNQSVEISQNISCGETAYDGGKSSLIIFDKAKIDNNKINNEDHFQMINVNSHKSVFPITNLRQRNSSAEKSIEKPQTVHEIPGALAPLKPDFTSVKRSVGLEKPLLDLNSRQEIPLSANISDTIPDFRRQLNKKSTFQKHLDELTNLYKQNVENKDNNKFNSHKKNSCYGSTFEVDIEIKTITVKEKFKVYETRNFEDENEVNNSDFTSNMNVEKLCFVKESVHCSSQIQSRTINNNLQSQNTASFCRDMFENHSNPSNYEMTNENRSSSNVYENIVPEYFSVDETSKNMSTRRDDYFRNIPNMKTVREVGRPSHSELANGLNEEDLPKKLQKQFQLNETTYMNPDKNISTLRKKDLNVSNIHKNNKNSLNIRCNGNIIFNGKPQLSKYQQHNKVSMDPHRTAGECTAGNETGNAIDSKKKIAITQSKCCDEEAVVLKRKPQCVPTTSYPDNTENGKYSCGSDVCTNEIKEKLSTNDHEQAEKNTVLEPKINQGNIKPMSLTKDTSDFVRENGCCQNETVQNPGKDPSVWKLLQKFQTEMQGRDGVTDKTSNIVPAPDNEIQTKQVENKNGTPKQKRENKFRLQDINGVMEIDLNKFIDSDATVLTTPGTARADCQSIHKSNCYLNTLLNPPIPRPGGKKYHRPNNGDVVTTYFDNDGNCVDLEDITRIDLSEENETLIPDVEEIVKCSEKLLEDNFMRPHNEEDLQYYAPASFKSMLEQYSKPNANAQIIADEDVSPSYDFVITQSLVSEFEDFNDVEAGFSDNESSPQLDYSPLKSSPTRIFVRPTARVDQTNSSFKQPYSEISSQSDSDGWNKLSFCESTVAKGLLDQETDGQHFVPSSFKQMFAQYSEQDSKSTQLLPPCYSDTVRPDFENLKQIQSHELEEIANNDVVRFTSDMNSNRVPSAENLASNRSPIICEHKRGSENLSNGVGTNYTFTVKRHSEYDRASNSRKDLQSFKYVKERKDSHKPVDSRGLLPTWRMNKYMTKMKSHFHK